MNLHKHDLTIYGIKIIRNEIRQAPKHVKDRYNLRLALLSLYDTLTKNRILEVKPLTKKLANLYFQEYRKNKGGVSWKRIMNDMIIVAEATISKLDVVVSEDNKTMLSSSAKKAYYSVNKQNNLLTPNFIGYKEFKRKLF